MNIFLRWLVVTVAILVAAYFIPGVVVAGVWTALWLALFLGIVNVILKPILIIITLPVNILTLGLFTFVINALLVLLASTIIKGFTVGGFLNALLFSVSISIISYLLQSLFKDRRQGGF